MRKVLAGAGKEQLNEQLRLIEERAASKGGYKSRYLALNLMVDYLEPYSYLESHPSTVKEVLESATDTLTNGKYVLNFFEALLKKALTRSSPEVEQRWFAIWVDEYLSALRSPHEALRDAVCALITPIVIKLNKNSLPLILATLLSAESTGAHEHLSMQILE